MELVLYRTYNAEGTTGDLYIDGVFICHTIELPWLDNEPRRSCIPEGRYALQKRCSPKFDDHLLVTGVKNRSMILLHPANHATKELSGCIAPVVHLLFIVLLPIHIPTPEGVSGLVVNDRGAAMNRG